MITLSNILNIFFVLFERLPDAKKAFSPPKKNCPLNALFILWPQLVDR
jgi:hypothetical protein